MAMWTKSPPSVIEIGGPANGKSHSPVSPLSDSPWLLLPISAHLLSTFISGLLLGNALDTISKQMWAQVT